MTYEIIKDNIIYIVGDEYLVEYRFVGGDNLIFAKKDVEVTNLEKTIIIKTKT